MSLDVSLYYNEECLFDANITHNLIKMANEAGIYHALWCPDEIPTRTAKELIPLLENGLAKLKSDPDGFKVFNASNGWGKYENLVSFTEEYLNACIEYPESEIEISK